LHRQRESTVAACRFAARRSSAIVNARTRSRRPRRIADYDTLFDPFRQARQAKSGHRLGDPAKAVRAMLTVIDSDDPPTQLLLGSDALELVRKNLRQRSSDIASWEALTRSTDG